MLRGASWSRNSTTVSRSGSAPSPRRPIRSPAVGCCISPSDTMRRASRRPGPEQASGRSRGRAQRHRHRSSPDRARPEAPAPAATSKAVCDEITLTRSTNSAGNQECQQCPSKKSKMRIENMLKAALSRNAGGEGAMPEAQSGISRRIRI